MKVLWSFKLLGTTPPVMQHCIPEDLNPLNHHYENLKLKIILPIKLGQIYTEVHATSSVSFILCPVKLEDQLCSNVSVCLCVVLSITSHKYRN